MQLDVDIWERTRRAWLFTRLTALDGLQDYQYFKELYTSVHKSKDNFSVLKLFKDIEKKDKFVELAKELAEGDPSVSEMAEQEDYYFSARVRGAKTRQEELERKQLSLERHAIARKITMVRELSQDFVADGRLWRWIEGMMQDLALT